MKNIKGKNALITGCSRGIGRYIANALAGEGVNLAMIAHPNELEQLNAVAQETAKLRAF